jgi:hypothetical protein
LSCSSARVEQSELHRLPRAHHTTLAEAKQLDDGIGL